MWKYIQINKVNMKDIDLLIGSRQKWLEASNHMPLFIEVK